MVLPGWLVFVEHAAKEGRTSDRLGWFGRDRLVGWGQPNLPRCGRSPSLPLPQVTGPRPAEREALDHLPGSDVKDAQRLPEELPAGRLSGRHLTDVEGSSYAARRPVLTWLTRGPFPDVWNAFGGSLATATAVLDRWRLGGADATEAPSRSFL